MAIHQFPRLPHHKPPPVLQPEVVSTRPHWVGRTWSFVVKLVWYATVLLWWPIRMLLIGNILFHVGLCVYYWGDPDRHPALLLLAHFSFAVAVTYFVSVYRPKGC